jgi:NhaA family Na+:H+ antiporter
MHADRPVARAVSQPVVRFLQIEAAGGILLLAATAAALVWANSPWSAGYHHLWAREVSLEVGPLHLAEDLEHWVNDALMALFFFVVGLEIKRELVDGRLQRLRDAALPGLAALGGMVVPALIFLVVTAGTPASGGWGIPMATDIAFALGVLALLGDRIPASLKVLLLGLAIADDIGVIIVIAVFYSEDLSLPWLLAACGGVLLVVVLRQVGVWSVLPYALVGLVVWGCTLESGVHATIAGVVLGLLAPARPRLEAGEEVSVAERLEGHLHPWTSYVVIPIFALANAGVELGAGPLGDAAGSRVTAGVVLGLVVGKPLGVCAFAWLAVRTGLARLPDDLGWPALVGMAGLAGIGFTVSIFVSGLAYADLGLQAEAKVGVLVASTLAAALGSAVLLRVTSRQPDGQASNAS